jgi:hypothetical protein
MQDVPSSLLKGLRPYLLLEFYDYPYLTVDITNTGNLFLNYYIAGKGDSLSHILIEISSERLDLLLKGEDSLYQVFNNPENEIVYFAVFNIKGEINQLGILDLNLFRKLNPIPINYK